MEECDICQSIIKNKNKKKHCLTKKHKYFSNLIINKYFVRNLEIDKFKDIIQPNYNNHKKLDNFSVCVMWKKNDVLINKISVPSTITLQKPYLFKPNLIELSIVVRVPPFDFPDTVDRSCINDEVDEINIIFISDLDNITFSHYMTQPKSMIQRKLINNFIKQDYGDFNCNWRPKCFRQINTRLSHYINGDDKRCIILFEQT